MKYQVYKVNARYAHGHKVDGKEIYSTGHWIAAVSEVDAIRIATQYKVGYPMGTGRYHEIVHVEFEPKRRYIGKVWLERNGKLEGFDTPFDPQDLEKTMKKTKTKSDLLSQKPNTESTINFDLKDAIALYRFLYITSANVPVNPYYSKLEKRLYDWIYSHSVKELHDAEEEIREITS